MKRLVQVEREGPVAILTLDDPPSRNGLSPEMRAQLVPAFGEVADDDEVRAIVVTGAGEHFCGGSDLRAIKGQDIRGRVERTAVFQRFILSWAEIPKPVLVAVEGAAAGGGVAMTLASDWAVAAEDAYFVPGYIRIALVPDVSMMWMLVRAIGEKKAKDWILSNRRVTAEEALTWGLLSVTCGSGAALETARAKAHELAELPGEAVAATKRLFVLARSSHPRDFILGELYAIGYLFRGDEHTEGVDAFLEKRKPNW